jgi:hypothetical protein
MGSPHSVYSCRFCRRRLWLSDQILERPFAPVGIVCSNCKRFATYSLDKNSPYYDGTAKREYSVPVVTTSLGARRCVEANCKTPLLLFALTSLPIEEEEKRREVDGWIWDDLKCPSGHLIIKPDRL